MNAALGWWFTDAVAGPHANARPEGNTGRAEGCRSGRVRAAPEQTCGCAERDDAHSGTGDDLLGAVEGLTVDAEVVASRGDRDGDGGVEQEQEPEHWPGGEQRLDGVSLPGGEL